MSTLTVDSMLTATISKGGTAWLKDMEAQGIQPTGGWQNSPNAAYYASLDSPTVAQAPSAPSPTTTSMQNLIKLQGDAAQGNQGDVADQIQQQMKTLASENFIPSIGNIINDKA